MDLTVDQQVELLTALQHASAAAVSDSLGPALAQAQSVANRQPTSPANVSPGPQGEETVPPSLKYPGLNREKVTAWMQDNQRTWFMNVHVVKDILRLPEPLLSEALERRRGEDGKLLSSSLLNYCNECIRLAIPYLPPELQCVPGPVWRRNMKRWYCVVPAGSPTPPLPKEARDDE